MQQRDELLGLHLPFAYLPGKLLLLERLTRLAYLDLRLFEFELSLMQL